MVLGDFQVPAAVLLLAGGFVSCFFGYRVFRIVLAIYGFILGALLANTLLGSADPTIVIVAGLIGGLMGAAVMIVAYFIGVALVGAGLGALVTTLAFSQIGGEPRALVVILASVVGALVALALQRHVVVVGTAFAGAWTMILGGLGLTGDPIGLETIDVWLIFPMNPEPGNPTVMAAWLGLGLLGTIIQYAVTAPKK